MNAYIYQAALYCESCIDEIKRNLTAPENPEDETAYDSWDYPKGPFSEGGGEADSPQHCDRCGVFLENPLTSEGYDYVQKTIQEVLETGRESVAVQEWAPFYRI